MVKKLVKSLLGSGNLSDTARLEKEADDRGLPGVDPGSAKAIELGMSWLYLAQDKSKTQDGGVARHYSLIDGWSSSYPETTGYIVETFLKIGRQRANRKAVERARIMLEWLVSIQFANGAFAGGMVDQEPRVPVTFNTGQILTGLCEGVRLDRRYLEPMKLAADWLVRTQDSDGCWRMHATPFAAPGEKVYESHVALGLFRAAEIESDRGYAEAARRNIDWGLQYQRQNGWLDKCCLSSQEAPLTHTIGYALRGFIEAYLFTKDPLLLDACCRTADGLIEAFEWGGRLPGRLDEQWRPAVPWVCLTGTSQVAECLYLLFECTKNDKYQLYGRAANTFVRRTMRADGPPEQCGGVKGSFPIDGDYGKWQFLNWACKFMIDANMAEQRCMALQA